MLIEIEGAISSRPDRGLRLATVSIETSVSAQLRHSYLIGLTQLPSGEKPKTVLVEIKAVISSTPRAGLRPRYSLH